MILLMISNLRMQCWNGTHDKSPSFAMLATGVDLPALVAKPPRSMKHTVSQKKGLKKLRTNLVALICDLQSTPFALQAD